MRNSHSGLRLFASGLRLAALLAFASAASAYEGEAHSVLTGDAFDRSVLADAQSGPLAHLGLDQPLTRIFNSTAVDPKFASGDAREIVAFGARFEDLPEFELRFLQHFFDPQNGGRGLTVPVYTPNMSSPDWELEDGGAVSEQLYSLHDARDFFYLSLVSSAADVRERYLVFTLEAIGRATHHLQDMAQPAHTRNDPHPLGLDGDLYEQATDDVADAHSGAFPQGVVYPTPAVDLHTFDTARKFWQGMGLGIAEMTATNFVSQDTNFQFIGTRLAPAVEFPQPPGSPCEGAPLMTEVAISDLDLNLKNLAIPGFMWFIGTPVYDRYLSGSAATLCDTRMSAFSLFDFDLALIALPMKLQLNRYTWAAAREILLPRAIAYSAGLINYFFRGALEVGVTDESDMTVALDVQNQALGEFALSDGDRSATSAEFEVWYDAADGTRKAAAVVSGRDLAGATVAYGASHTIRFTRPPDLDSSLPQPYMLVFRGTIGTEEGVIGVAFGPGHAGFVVTPDPRAVDGITAARVIAHTAQGWKAAQPPALAGNVDWRGAVPGDLLTWAGPQSRYFLAPGQLEQLSPAIYSNGALLATAPAAVLGAAIRRTGAGARELVAATYASGLLEIYARPLTPDSAGTPQWYALYSSIESAPASPAFASASGAEFQFLTVDGQRVKLHVAQSSARVERSTTRGSGTQSGQYASHISPLVCGEDLTDDESYQVHWSQPTILCADYVGDTEVLCRLDADPAMTIHETLHEGLEGTVVVENLNYQKTTSTRRYLSVGNLQIPITGSVAELHTVISDAYHLFDDDTPGINEHQAATTTGYDTRLLYLDARNDIAAFVEENTVRNVTSDAEGATHAALSGYLRNGSYVDETHLESRLTVMHEGMVETLGASDGPAKVLQNAVHDAVVNPLCGSAVAQDVSGTLAESTIDDRGLDVGSFVHPSALQIEVTQGLAVDGAGDFAASLPIISLDSSGREVVSGVWNYLSGGSLPALLPSASATPRYFPLAPLR